MIEPTDSADVVGEINSAIPALSPSQIHVMKHALGLDWSDSPYRNGFLAPVGHHNRSDCEALEKFGIMERNEVSGAWFSVNERGLKFMFGHLGWKAAKKRIER